VTKPIRIDIGKLVDGEISPPAIVALVTDDNRIIELTVDKDSLRLTESSNGGKVLSENEIPAPGIYHEVFGDELLVSVSEGTARIGTVLVSWGDMLIGVARITGYEHLAIIPRGVPGD
jgi:hypothetical protein